MGFIAAGAFFDPLRLAFLAHTDALGAGNAVRHKGQIQMHVEAYLYGCQSARVRE